METSGNKCRSEHSYIGQINRIRNENVTMYWELESGFIAATSAGWLGRGKVEQQSFSNAETYAQTRVPGGTNTRQQPEWLSIDCWAIC